MRYQAENLKGKLILSAIMHVVMLLLLYFGLPYFSSIKPLPIPWTPVPVDIVEIGEITNTKIKNDEGETAKTAPPEPPAPAPEQKPEPPKPDPKPSVPEPPKPELQQPDEAALPKPTAKPKPPEPPKPKPAPAADPLASVLKNVAQLKPAAPKVEQAAPAPTRNEGTSATGKVVGQGPSLSDRLTISQEDALRRQIGQCWNMPIGARNAEDLIVEVLIEVNEDRTVRSAEVVDRTRLATDSAFRAAAEAALRALHHPKCTPLELPPDQYERWKTIRFNFDPRDML